MKNYTSEIEVLQGKPIQLLFVNLLHVLSDFFREMWLKEKF